MSLLKWTTLSLFFYLLVRGGDGQAVFQLAEGIYADGMVLQMGPKKAQLWGFGQPGARISVDLDGVGTLNSTTVQGDSKWFIKLPSQPAGGPHNLTINEVTTKGVKASLQLREVMFGDVWVCAGEGNMAFAMKDIHNATAEMQLALNYTRLKILHVAPNSAASELDEILTPLLPWGSLSSGTVGTLPALCLLYGERLSDALPDRHIGLVAAAWSDTPIEAWVSPKVTNLCQTPPNPGSEKSSNSAVWNGMVYPLTQMTVRGAIWAQGESNVEYNLPHYACHFKHLTIEWRETFSDGAVNVTDQGWAFPFGFVQVGALPGKRDEWVGRLRFHQTMDTQVAPNNANNETFMAQAFDLPDSTSPFGSAYYRDKQTVATRLAAAARRLIYNETQLQFMGPSPNLVWDYETSMMNVSYFWDIRINGKTGDPSGFSYQDPTTKEWISAPILEVFEETLSFWVHPNYTHVAFAFSAEPCSYLNTSVYSENREPDLPHSTTLFPPF